MSKYWFQWLLAGCVATSFANAAEGPVFGTLEFDGASYKVLPRLSVDIDGNRAFPAEPSSGVKRWSMDWVGGQPAFSTKRFECRSDDKPASCFDSKQMSLPACSRFAGLEAEFIKVSATKSGYGDTPEERGAPSLWSKLSATEKVGLMVLGPPVAFGGAVGAGAAVVLMSPFLAVKAIANSECVGWKTKWVEFDHDDFAKKVSAGFAEMGMDSQAVRADGAGAYARFAKAVAEHAEQMRTQIRDEQTTLARRNTTVRQFIIQWAGKNALPRMTSDDIKMSRWTMGEADHAIRVDYASAQDDAKVRIEKFYDAEALRWTTAAKLDQAELEGVAFKLAADKVKDGMSLDLWGAFLRDIQQLGAPREVLSAAESARDLAQKEWREYQARLEAERVAREKREQEAERKARAAFEREVAAFRKNLKFGARTNCGPVLEVRQPLVKVAFPVDGYGTEHWVEIARVYPDGQGCRFVNGRYEPPDVY